MVFNHTGNTTNGNAMNKVGATAGAGLLGRTTQLQILEVNYTTFRNNNISGPKLHAFVSAMLVNNDADLIIGNRQPTDHDDRLGNLPLAPGGGVIYREYFLSGNMFAWPGFLRMVADLLNRRLYITPTHYDTWLQNPVTAASANIANAIAANTASSRNPFFLLRGVNAPNNLFD